jgi:hypothetical protein
VGPARFELATSPLSGVRSNQLSYEPDRGKMIPDVAGIAKLNSGVTKWHLYASELWPHPGWTNYARRD